MSYLSATENVGFGGIPQNISDASCATQYKMAVEGVSGNCSEVMYIPDNSADDSTYITHLNDNFYSKFKIDPNELYTFHDSDVIAGEITVSHTEDTFIFPESVDAKTKFLDSPNNELDILGAFTNGDVKKVTKKKVVTNGHYGTVTKTIQKESKTSNTKAQKTKNQIKEARRESVSEVRKQNAQSPKAQIVAVSIPSSKNSINSIQTSNSKPAVSSKQTANETFLDVFKREQGLVENDVVVVKTEPQALPPPSKIPTSPPKKTSVKTQSQSKPRRGRGPAVHEALQRISAQKRVIPISNTKWHAPGDNLFDCGPLDNKTSAFRVLDSSSSDEDHVPDFESGNGPVCVEESAAESRGSRLALRRAALRRHVARAHVSLRLSKDFKERRTLASIIKKQLNTPGPSGQLPTQTVNHLLALRGMTAVLNAQERRKLRESGWSGGECLSSELSGAVCAEDKCTQPPIPCGRHCLTHVTLAPEQRLYAACAAVFAGGARCKAPLLPLQEQTPLCAEHAWKRDNYDKLVKDNKPKKVSRPRVVPQRRPKRRRRPLPRVRTPAPPPTAEQSLSEINVCSNSSTYDSSEETTMGALSESEYITVPSHELEVEHVPADDILDPAVLSQIPDEAFTEFFNQGIVLAEGETSFGESSELAAALEAVLDERGLDERELDVRRIDDQTLDDHELEESGLQTMDHSMFNHSPVIRVVKGKVIQGRVSVPMEVSSSASS